MREIPPDLRTTGTLHEDYYTEEIRKAEAQGHELNENYFQRANFRVALDKYKEALADYDRAIELNPDDAVAYSNRGIAKSELGQYEAAFTDYDAAIRLNPDSAEAYYNRGNAKAVLDQREAAQQDFTTARDLVRGAGNDSLVALAEQRLQALANRGAA